MENLKQQRGHDAAGATGTGWMTVPAFGDWDMKNGALPDYSMDFSKIREMRRQNKKELSRASPGGDEDLPSAQQRRGQQAQAKKVPTMLGRPVDDHRRAHDNPPTGRIVLDQEHEENDLRAESHLGLGVQFDSTVQYQLLRPTEADRRPYKTDREESRSQPIATDMAPVEVQNTSVSVTPYLRTPEDDRRLAAAGYGAVPLPTTVAARAIEKARSYCTGRAAACSSDEELVASFLKELVAANWLKVISTTSATRVRVGSRKSKGFRRFLRSRTASGPPGRRRSGKRRSRGRGWTPSKAFRPLLVAVTALFVCINTRCKGVKSLFGCIDSCESQILNYLLRRNNVKLFP